MGRLLQNFWYMTHATVPAEAMLNIPASVSLLSSDRKPQIRFKETVIPEMETINIYPLECKHAL